MQLCESNRRIFDETGDQKSERIRNRDGCRERSKSLFNRGALGSDGSGSIYKMQSRNAAGAQFCILSIAPCLDLIKIFAQKFFFDDANLATGCFTVYLE